MTDPIADKLRDIFDAYTRGAVLAAQVPAALRELAADVEPLLCRGGCQGLVGHDPAPWCSGAEPRGDSR